MKPELPLTPAFLKFHEPKLQLLFDRYEREKAMPPTLLFTGIEGVGKKSLVLYFIQTLFCDRVVVNAPEDEGPSLFGDMPSSDVNSQIATEFKPCGECKSCKRALQNQWLDLYWREPESNDEETRMGIHKIDAFREIKEKLGMGPAEEPFKVVVIADADRMTVQAANSILKTLEEPPKNWIFILTAADSSRLLPTILSRCLEVKLNPLPPTTLFQVLKEIKGAEFNSQKAQVASRAAQGSVSRALLFMEEDVWKTRGMLLGLLTNPAHEWMPLIDFLSQSQRDLILGLDLIESIYTDLLKYRLLGADYDWIHADQKELLIQWVDSRGLTSRHLSQVLTAIAEKRRYSTLTLNAKLLAQDVLAPLLQTILKPVVS